MRISQETIDDIRNSADIATVIGHYIPLIQKGKGYTAICPFHDDHDPSLSISQDKQIYKCFVCGNGGNVFTFVSNFKKISFIEAVAEVAKIIGKPLEIDVTAPKRESRYQHFYDLLNDYITYTNYLLTATNLGKEAKEYLLNRGIDEEIINEFQIGYNPDGKRIYANLKNKEYSDEEMNRVNIAKMGDSGIYEVFYNRITFPIHDKYGNPIAFTARDFKGFSDSKYINTSQTVIYTKGDILFNYHRAKEAVKQLGYCIVCEGVMDVIAYKRAGINNVIATLGTALSTNQVAGLKELSKKIVLSYDGDKAGQAANMKNGAILLDNKFDVFVVDNNTELDPDEIVTKYGKNALRDLASKQLSYIDYAFKYYRNIYNLQNYSDRKEMALKLSPLIDKLPDRYDQDNYANELYEITKIRKLIGETKEKSEYNNKRIFRPQALDGLTKAEYSILLYMAMSQNGKDIYQKQLGYLLDEDNSQLANLIIDQYRQKGKCSLSALYDECEDEKLRQVIASLGTYDELVNEYNEDLLIGAINRIKEEIKHRKLEDLKAKIAKSEIIDPEQTKTYLFEYSELLKELGGQK